MLQIDELTVQTTERDDEQDIRNRELGDARGEVEKLLAIINVSKDSNTEHEKRLAERDTELVCLCRILTSKVTFANHNH